MVPKRISRFVTGPEDMRLENKVFNSATFVLAVLTVFIALSTVRLSSDTGYYLPLAVAPLIFAFFFYNARFREHFKSTSYFFMAFSLVFFDYVWFTAIPVTQAVDLLFPFLLVLGLTILPVGQHLVFTVISIANILVLDLLAFLFPEWMLDAENTRAFPFYLYGHIFLISFMLLLLVVIGFFKKAYERERYRATEQYRLLSNNNQALTHRNEHLESLARMVSHNLRSPMAGMKMLFDLYEKVDEPAEREDLIANLKEGAAQLFDMVEDLSSIMLDYKELNKEKQPVELEDIAQSAIAQLSGQIKSQKAAVHTDFSAYPVVHYSPTYLESIFLNMTSNALKYSSPDRPPVIDIRSYQEGMRVMLSFTDNGLGIDLSQHRAQLFKMYKTFHRKAGADSKGIGLFITKNQVEMMGGKITVESQPDQGTTFYIELYRV